jgi:hypothetical protein
MRTARAAVCFTAVSFLPATFLACGGGTTSVAADSGLESDATTDSQADGSDSRADVQPDVGKAETGASAPDGATDATTTDATTLDGGRDAALDAAETAADGGEEAEASAPWTPAAIRSQLVFWFDPTSLLAVNGGVPKWTDLSGNNNDALQTTAAYQPAYNPSGIGGLPSATFNGPVTFLVIPDNATMQWGTADFAVFAVIRATSATIANFAMIYQKTGAAPQYDGFDFYINSAKPVASQLAAAQVAGNVYVDNAAPPSTFIDSTVHLLAGRRTGTTLEIRVDGASSNNLTAASVAVDVSAVGANAAIGQNGGGNPPGAENQQLHGDIAEVIAVKGTMTPTDLTNVENYLKSRYSIP